MKCLRLRTAVIPLVSVLLLVTATGPNCSIVVPVDEDPVTTIKLVNHSDERVSPLVYADPGTVHSRRDIMIPDNFVSVGPPMELDETVLVDLACDDAGTIYTDADLTILPDGTVLSPGQLLHEGDDFACGDTITVTYEPLAQRPVTIELINTTSNDVDAFLWADPQALVEIEDLMVDENLIDVGPPLEPGELVTVTLDCADAGTLLAGGDMLLVPNGTLEAQNWLLLDIGTHFTCGDVVSIYYEVDNGGVFFTSVDVNDVTLH